MLEEYLKKEILQRHLNLDYLHRKITTQLLKMNLGS